VTGAVTALGDTLFPAASLAEGLRQDASATVHALVRLRVWHPLLAVAVAIGLVVYSQATRQRAGEVLGASPQAVVALVTAQLSAGVLTLVLPVPVWMQPVHLVLADSVWVALVVLAARAAEAESGALRRATAEGRGAAAHAVAAARS